MATNACHTGSAARDVPLHGRSRNVIHCVLNSPILLASGAELLSIVFCMGPFIAESVAFVFCCPGRRRVDNVFEHRCPSPVESAGARASHRHRLFSETASADVSTVSLSITWTIHLSLLDVLYFAFMVITPLRRDPLNDARRWERVFS